MLRRLRLQRQWTQEEVARRVNASVQAATGRHTALDANFVSRLERGAIAWPNAEYRQALRLVFGVPDDAALGLVPHRTSRDRRTSEPDGRVTRLAICGSRAPGCPEEALDLAVRGLARLVFTHECAVSHGPVGIGIEVMTYIADHYRPSELSRTVCTFGHLNVVRAAHYVIAAGGSTGTRDEIDLAYSLGIPVLAIAPTGGAAQEFHDRVVRAPSSALRLTEPQVTQLRSCGSTEDYLALIENVLTADAGAAS